MFVTDKRVLSFSHDVTQSLAPDSEYNSWCQHFLLPCSKYCWSGQVSFHWKDHFLSWLWKRENLSGFRRDTCVSVRSDYNLCSFQLKTSLHHKEARQRNVNSLLGYKLPGSSSSHCHLFSDHQESAREHSAKRGTPGKSCKSESRNLSKHCAELKYWISRCHAHPL